MIIRWNVTLFSLSVASFFCFAWAMRFHFKPSLGNPKSIGMTLITILGTVSFCTVSFSILANSEVWAASAGAATILFLFSQFMFWWAVYATRRQGFGLAFSGRMPRALLQTGPYRYIRHPFYLAYSTFWLAGVIAANRAGLLLIVLLMIGLYYRAASLEESKFEESPLLSADYAKYKRTTGMFFPKIPVLNILPGMFRS